MKALKILAAAVALLTGSSAFAQLAVIDSGRFTTGVMVEQTMFKANELPTSMRHDVLMLGYKLYSKERWIVGGGVGQSMNGVVVGGPGEEFGNEEGQRIFLQGQYGIYKTQSNTYVYGNLKVERDTYKWYNNRIDVAWSTHRVETGILVAHRWIDFTLFEGLDITPIYKGYAYLSGSEVGTVKYTINKLGSVDGRIGFSYRMNQAVDFRWEVSGGTGLRATAALDFKL